MISPNAYSGSLNSCQLPIYWGNDDSSHAKRPVDRAFDTIRLHSRPSELVSLAGGLLLNDLDCGKLSITVWVGAWKTRMQFTMLPGGSTARRTTDGENLFEGEFLGFHADIVGHHQVGSVGPPALAGCAPRLLRPRSCGSTPLRLPSSYPRLRRTRSGYRLPARRR